MPARRLLRTDSDTVATACIGGTGGSSGTKRKRSFRQVAADAVADARVAREEARAAQNQTALMKRELDETKRRLLRAKAGNAAMRTKLRRAKADRWSHT